MRILVVTGIFPPDIGGPASYVPRIAAALTERNHEIEVVTLADPEALRDPAQFDFPVHRILRQMNRPLRVLRTTSLIRSLARDADVIYANGLVLEAVVAAQLSRRPLVVKVVGDTIWERARSAGRTESLDAFQTAKLPVKWRASRTLQDTYMQAVQHVITPSDYLKKIVCGWGVAENRISVVYNAVPGANGSVRDVAPEVDVVSVGRLVPWKGFDKLIEIAARRNWTLSIVGDGPLRSELEALARSTGDRVRFEGRLPQAEVGDAIRRASVFALNSSYEGLPHIVLEAMAAGVPVVATAAGGTPETIIDGASGLLVPVGDSAAMEDALAKLVGSEQLRDEIRAGARAALAEKFSFERMVRDTEASLASVVRGDGAKGGQS